ncbi:putative sterigmatocystin biosynthesis peroxidase stcC [Pseudocercospora fuligena]|uniref:Putative sterigmatocystin biosynthesis peroxidase stcC n=1 Tax=Pseudocercospora fuligena TaxID=685502 RepID=A0A8H6RDI5_9PEZI|nr:putative sterigmatocystin biosynthesis peroxidase stcC [Pseudocercospora fuligena]
MTMNTLANHQFLHHDGRNLTRENVVYALTTAINFNESLANIMFDQALPANPEPNATFFTLDMLNRHNVLEHDASMSRSDAYFGNNHVFNQTIFDETRKYWTGPTLDRNMLANGKVARMLQSRASNPEYRFTNVTEAFSIGEVLAPVAVFGDRESVTVNKTLVDFFFGENDFARLSVGAITDISSAENEKLPTKLGWKAQEKVVGLEDITRLSEIFAEASTLLTTDDTAAAHKVRRDGLHAMF